MGRKLFRILMVLVFVAGFGLLVYPTVSNQWNTYRQNRLIASYDEVVNSQMTEEDFTKEWEKARSYNEGFHVNHIYSDSFALEDEAADEDSQKLLADTPYGQALNVAGNGVMGYLSIPKINIKLAIYHGSAADVLQTGVGHFAGTALPIGGESTHSVLAAHRGLPSAKLFTDIDQLEEGDEFYIVILNETFAYEVDEIHPMVDKDDSALLEELLSVQEGKDLVTLFTCTPYGVNSHRLLVRGHRTEYIEEPKEEKAIDAVADTVEDYYMLLLLAGLAVTAVAVVILRFALRGRAKQSENEVRPERQSEAK